MGIVWLFRPSRGPGVADKEREWFYAGSRHDGATRGMLSEMRAREQLYGLTGFVDLEASDASIKRSIVLVVAV